MKKIMLAALTVAAAACAPMRHPATLAPAQQNAGKTAPAPEQTAQPETPAPATN